MDIIASKPYRTFEYQWPNANGVPENQKAEFVTYTFNGVKNLSLTQVALMVTVNRANQVEKEIIDSMEEIAEINKKLEIANKAADQLSKCGIDDSIRVCCTSVDSKYIDATKKLLSSISGDEQITTGTQKVEAGGTTINLHKVLSDVLGISIENLAHMDYADCQDCLKKMDECPYLITYYDGFDADGNPIEKTLYLSEAIELITGETVSQETLDYEGSLEYYNKLTREMDSLNSLNQENMINLQSFVNKRDQAYELGSNIDKLMFSGYMTVARSI